MDTDGRIYEEMEEKIPPEDKARLDGFLRGRAEADQRDRLREKLAEVEQLLAEFKKTQTP